MLSPPLSGRQRSGRRAPRTCRPAVLAMDLGEPDGIDVTAGFRLSLGEIARRWLNAVAAAQHGDRATRCAFSVATWS